MYQLVRAMRTCVFKQFSYIKACTNKTFKVRQKLVVCSCHPGGPGISNSQPCGMVGSIKLYNNNYLLSLCTCIPDIIIVITHYYYKQGVASLAPWPAASSPFCIFHDHVATPTASAIPCIVS